MMLAAAGLSERIGHPLWTGLTALWIGAFPLHDVLVMGHEAMHGNASRNRVVNGFVLWLTHALVGISGRAHRSFHFDHHRFVNGPRDPELRIHGAMEGRTTWRGLVRIVFLAHPFVNGHPWRGAVTRVTGGQVVVDLLGAVVLHGLLVAALGPRMWLLYGVLPATTGLPLISALRAAAEHLAPRRHDWVRTRAYRARWIGQIAWSNVDHHVEHHLFPAVPFHRLPELRRRLAQHYENAGLEIEHGLFRTAFQVTWEAMGGEPGSAGRPNG